MSTTYGAVMWHDAGGEHEGGMAPCLRVVGSLPWVRFGWSLAHGLDGSSWREVDWVQCVAHP